MFRIVRVPPTLDHFFHPLQSHFHWNHFMYFRLLVVTIAFMWGRRNVATLYRYLDAERHRTRFNNFFLVERWDPEAALRQQAQALLRILRPGKGDTIYLIIDDSKHAKRGKAMDAIAKRKTPRPRPTSGGISMSAPSWSAVVTSFPLASGSTSKKPTVRP